MRVLVYTHYRWHHVWGPCAWPGVEFVGNTAGPLLEAEALRPWSREYLRGGIAENPLLEPSFVARARVMTTWDGFVVRPA